MKTKRLIVTILLALPFCLRMLGCTVMIVAASATEDGRPMLFKNRDSANAYMVDIRIDHQEGFKFIAQYALRALKSIIFPYQENTTKLIDLSKLYNRDGTGIMQRIVKIEGEIIERGNSLIANARQSGMLSEESLTDYYAWLDKYIEQEYEYNFDAMITSIQNQGQRTKQNIGCWDIDGKRRSNPPSYRGIVIYNQRKYLKY